jgi:hypothetical protein
MTYSNYTEFFRKLAKYHKQLRHTPEKPSFFRAVVTEDPLGSNYHVDEMLKAFRSTIKLPCMVMELFTFQDDNKQMADNIRRTRVGGIIILDKVDKHSHDSLEQTLDKCDGIAQEIMAYVMAYYRKYEQKGRLELNSVQGEPVGPVGDNLYGIRRNFEITNPVNLPYLFDSEKFDDELLPL